MFADELAKTELKLKEQLKTNESLKLQLAAAEDRYKVRLHASYWCLQSSLVFRLDSIFIAVHGCFSSRIETLMLSLPLEESCSDSVVYEQAYLLDGILLLFMSGSGDKRGLARRNPF